MNAGARRVGVLSGVLGVLVLVYLAGLIAHRPQAEPLLVRQFKIPSVTKIEAGSIRLRKEGSGAWQVSIDGSWYPADSGKVDQMLTGLSGMRVNRVVTGSKSEWASFSVNDSSAAKLMVSGANGPIATLFVGTTGADGGTYVRTSAAPEVFEVFGNFSDYVSSDASYWSYLKILPAQVTVDSLQTISISGHGFSVGGATNGESYLLTSSVVNGKSAWVAAGQQALDQKKVLSLEAELLQLEGDRFAAQVSSREAGMTHPSAVIELTDQQGGSWTVIVGKRYGAQFYVKRGDAPYIYLVNQWSLHRALPTLDELKAAR